MDFKERYEVAKKQVEKAKALANEKMKLIKQRVDEGYKACFDELHGTSYEQMNAFKQLEEDLSHWAKKSLEIYDVYEPVLKNAMDAEKTSDYIGGENSEDIFEDDLKRLEQSLKNFFKEAQALKHASSELVVRRVMARLRS